MKKIRNKYIRVWVLLFVLFSAAVIVIPGLQRGFDAMDWMFGFALGALEISLVLQLICVCTAFRGETKQKYFHGTPLIRTSYLGLFLTVVLGAVCLLVRPIPDWTGFTVGAVILIWEIAAAKKSSEKTAAAAEKTESSRGFIRSLTGDTEKLLTAAKTPEVKAACDRVLGALSKANAAESPSLSGVEAKICAAFAELSAAAENGDTSAARASADKVVSLLRDRNNNCKLLK